jgi:hypothetical protein
MTDQLFLHDCANVHILFVSNWRTGPALPNQYVCMTCSLSDGLWPVGSVELE